MRMGLAISVWAMASACGLGGEPAPVRHADTATRRSTALGVVVGHAGSAGTHAWHGIPFAARRSASCAGARPSGERRGGARARRCLRLALYAVAAPDRRRASRGRQPGSEDCLYVNVYAPPFAPDAVPQGEARLPVMLWIHGGGNTHRRRAASTTAAIWQPSTAWSS